MEEAFCTCGHLLDEHSEGFLQECEVEGCGCICYEFDPEASAEAEQAREDEEGFPDEHDHLGVDE